MPRLRSEWFSYSDESQRIVSDDLWQRAQARLRPAVIDKGGGRFPRKFLLSGLLQCEVCGAHYIMTNARDYECSTHRDGAACSNSVRVRRDHAEDVLIGRLRSDLLSPESIQVIAKDMQAHLLDRTKAEEAHASQAPRELVELTARIKRLRGRLRAGDPDLTADELQVAIERAEDKLLELQAEQPTARPSAKVVPLLTKAAQEARREIAAALAGDSRASLKARVILRDAFGGKIALRPEPNGGLMAFWNLKPAALLRGVVPGGSGGSIARYRTIDFAR